MNLFDQILHTEDPDARRELLRGAPDLQALHAHMTEVARTALLSASPNALAAARAAADAAVLLNDPRGEAAAHRVEGQALRLAGRHADAITALEAAANAARRAGDPLLAAQVRIGEIDSLGWLGRTEDADALAVSLEAEFCRLGAKVDAGKVLVNRGNLAFRRDAYSEALGFYERAGEALLQSGEPVAVARVQASRANILTHLNRVEEAIPLFREAGETFAAHGLAQEAAMGDGNIGFLEYISGRLTAALASFQRARQAFESRAQEIEVAKADLDMGDIYRVLNLLPEAQEHYDRSVAVFDRRALPYERAKAMMGRGAALAGMDRADEALDALAEADALFRTQKNRLQRAHVALIRAQLLFQMGRIEEARAEAVAAGRGFRRDRLPGWAAEARYIPARIDLESERLAGQEAGSRAIRRMGAVARAARLYARGWLECRAEEALARRYQTQGSVGHAIRHYRRGIEALESVRTQVVPEEMHVAFLRDKLGVYDGLVGLLLSRGRPRDVRTALEQVERARSRLLLERLESALESDRSAGAESEGVRSDGAESLRARIAAFRAELNRAYHQIHTFDDRAPQRLLGGESAVSLRVRRLEEDYRTALREWEVAYGAAERPITDGASLDELQAGLDVDETLVEFYAGESAISAFIVTRGGARLCHNLAPAASVEQAARRFRYHIQRIALAEDYTSRHTRSLHEGVSEVTACLYEMLWRPLEGLIRTEKVTIVPHGLLHSLPFHAFGDPTHAVLDEWEVAYSPSATMRIRRAPAPVRTAGRPLLIGVPAPGIEQVSSEISALRRILPCAQVQQGAEATLAAFRREAPACSTLHLATHALFRADNPLFSGIRFADGWLLARDLYDIQLQCELATLSACQTGMAHVAPGDELFGLMRGFLAAGAKSVAASFWAADDDATAELMGRFYCGTAAGFSTAAALRSAQRAIRSERPHPYHWAAFSLTGKR